MLELLVADTFNRTGQLVNDEPADEDNVRELLDTAIGLLYDSVKTSGGTAPPVGASIEIGGIVLVKAPTGFDTYVFVGNYV